MNFRFMKTCIRKGREVRSLDVEGNHPHKIGKKYTPCRVGDKQIKCNFALLKNCSGRSVARYRAWFGTKRSSVRIWPPRPERTQLKIF
jgi:hypothetical protein